MKVECKVDQTSVENEEGRLVAGVCVTCGRCDMQAEAYGTGERSVRRALMSLREDCDQGEENFYVSED